MDLIQQLLFARQIRTCAAELPRDATALGRLYDLTAPRLLRFAQTLTRHRQDAEDALQTAMVRLAGKPQLLAAAWHPWAYLLGTVRHEALRISRRRRLWRAFTNESSLTSFDEALQFSLEVQDAVRLALAQLPPLQAEVMVLKLWEGLTFEEIAEVLHCSPNTVASRYRYALQKLARTCEPLAAEVWYE